jgi:hypothetical protein
VLEPARTPFRQQDDAEPGKNNDCDAWQTEVFEPHLIILLPTIKGDKEPKQETPDSAREFLGEIGVRVGAVSRHHGTI